MKLLYVFCIGFPTLEIALQKSLFSVDSHVINKQIQIHHNIQKNDVLCLALQKDRIAQHYLDLLQEKPLDMSSIDSRSEKSFEYT